MTKEEENKILKEGFKTLMQHNLSVKQIRSNARCISMNCFYEGKHPTDFQKVAKALNLLEEENNGKEFWSK